MIRNFFNFSIILSLVLILGLTASTNFSEVTNSAWATCSDCLTNPSIQTMSIYIHQTDDYPFLVGNATLLISPNPFAYTTNSTADPSTWNNSLIVTDGDVNDADPTVGIIDLVGVNNGTYAIYELKNPSGVVLNDTPVYVDISGTTGSISVINLLLNTTTTATDILPPTISNSSLNSLQNFGAKVNGVTISSGDDLPPAKIVTKDQAITISPPTPVILSNRITSAIDASSLFTNLAIPTYGGPSTTSSNTAFVPPLFSGSDNSGNSIVMTPLIDNIPAGTDLHMRLDNARIGSGVSPLHDISLPLANGGSNVGVRVQVNNAIPSGFPSAPSNIGSTLFLDVGQVGNVDLSDPNSFSSSPQIMFNVNLSGTTCPAATVYLHDTLTNRWDQVTPSPVRDSSSDTSTTCGYIQSVQHFSSYLIGSGSSGGSSSSSSSSSGSSSTGSSGGGGFGLVGVGPGGGSGGDMLYNSANNGALSMYEVDYDICMTHKVSVLAGTSGSPDSLGVKIRTPSSGVITGAMNVDQPLKSQNAYWFTVSPVSNDNSFTVYVENTSDSISKSITVNSCTGKVTLSELGKPASSSSMTTQSNDMQGQQSSMPVVPEFGQTSVMVFIISVLSMVFLSRIKKYNH